MTQRSLSTPCPTKKIIHENSRLIHENSCSLPSRQDRVLTPMRFALNFNSPTEFTDCTELPCIPYPPPKKIIHEIGFPFGRRTLFRVFLGNTNCHELTTNFHEFFFGYGSHAKGSVRPRKSSQDGSLECTVSPPPQKKIHENSRLIHDNSCSLPSVKTES